MQKLVSTQSGIIIPYHTNILDAHDPVRFMDSRTCLWRQFGGNGWAEHMPGKKLKLIAVMLRKEARTFACGLLYLGHPKLMLFD